MGYVEQPLPGLPATDIRKINRNTATSFSSFRALFNNNDSLYNITNVRFFIKKGKINSMEAL